LNDLRLLLRKRPSTKDPIIFILGGAILRNVQSQTFQSAVRRLWKCDWQARIFTLIVSVKLNCPIESWLWVLVEASSSRRTQKVLDPNDRRQSSARRDDDNVRVATQRLQRPPGVGPLYLYHDDSVFFKKPVAPGYFAQKIRRSGLLCSKNPSLRVTLPRNATTRASRSNAQIAKLSLLFAVPPPLDYYFATLLLQFTTTRTKLVAPWPWLSVGQEAARRTKSNSGATNSWQRSEFAAAGIVEPLRRLRTQIVVAQQRMHGTTIHLAHESVD